MNKILFQDRRMPGFVCKNCRRAFPDSGIETRCSICGGFFDFDGPLVFQPEQIETRQPGIWRYRNTFGLFAGAPVVSLGEGRTPLVWEEFAGQPVGLKMESLNPSGSYKDRGSSVLVSQLAARGVSQVLEDSSGNAGASLAAYAARARMQARIFVPEAASGPKCQQIESYGAELVRVAGPRSAAAQAVMDAVVPGKVYASHAYLPFGLAGIATLAYELWEDLGQAPGTIIVPAGHGGLLRGICMGFEALCQAGLIATRPYFVGVQARACAPLVAAFQHGLAALETVEEGATIAEGVRVRRPSQVEALLEAIPPGRGEFLAIDEDTILPAMRALGQRGIYVEPTAALAWCGLQELLKQGSTPLSEPIILVLSGSGLKYSAQ
jgi:threonine synthase